MTSPAPASIPAEPAEVMECLEIWGGNEPADRMISMPGLDAWVYAEPFQHAAGGGDVHYLSSCATGRITRMLVADVSGHGEAVADLAVSLRTLMRRYVNQLDQGRFVRALNREFTSQARDGLFATAVAATYFAPTSTLTWTNAGHPTPALYRADTGQWLLLEPEAFGERSTPNVPLGVLDLTDYDQRTLHLGPGDLVLCFTDFLTESRDSEGGMLGRNGVLETLAALHPRRPSDLIPDLLKRLRDMNGENLGRDDITLMLLTPNELRPTPSLVRKLLLPLRMMRQLAGSWRPGGKPMAWPDLNVVTIGGAMFNFINRRWKRRETDPPNPPSAA